MRTLAIVPARGGSKGLPGKHLLRVGGRPLIAWTLAAAKAAAGIGDIVVTSDDIAIIDVARQWGVRTLLRPDALAMDSTPTEPVVVHALANHMGPEPEVIVLLQPTSPLRTARDIDHALVALEESGADCVISVFEPPNNPWKCFYQHPSGYLAGLVDDEKPFRPRQSLPMPLMPNGAIYAVRTAHFRATGRFFGPRTIPFAMPPERSVDVDVGADLIAVENFLANAEREVA